MKKALFSLGVLLLACGLGFAGGTGEKDDGKLDIAGIVFQEDQFFKVVQIGMRDAARDFGVNLLESNSNSKPDKEIELVNTYISRGVDAIVISPLSATASIAALKKANDKGIKVVLYNSPIDADFPISYLSSEASDLGIGSGKAAASYIQTVLKDKKKIKVATLAFKSQFPEISDARVNGFLDQIKGLPGVEVVAQQDAWLTEDAVKRAGDIITANPDIDIIFGANDGGTVGATLAVKNAGKAGQIATFGIDVSEQIADFLLSPDNILQASTGQQPYLMGYLSVDNAVKACKGEKVTKTIVVPALPLLRTEPETVKNFKTEWAKYTSK